MSAVTNASVEEMQATIKEQRKTIKALTEIIAQLYFKYVPDGTELHFRKKAKT